MQLEWESIILSVMKWIVTRGPHAREVARRLLE